MQMKTIRIKSNYQFHAPPIDVSAKLSVSLRMSACPSTCPCQLSVSAKSADQELKQDKTISISCVNLFKKPPFVRRKI
jgi:hypothetical protein